MYRSHGCEIEWLENDFARISCKNPAIGIDPFNKKKIWFNNAFAYYTGYSNQWNDPKKAIFFGNGDQLPENSMAILKEVSCVTCGKLFCTTTVVLILCTLSIQLANPQDEACQVSCISHLKW